MIDVLLVIGEAFILVAGFFGWIFLVYSFLGKKPCTHPYLVSTKWKDYCDTPMVTSWCPDCHWRDEGHVYANPETWV